jgi:GTP cyclohydrolase I
VISIAQRTEPPAYELTDTQAEEPTSEFDVAIDKVGVRNFELPLTIAVRDDGSQEVSAEIDVGVNLSKAQRGAHLSRFIELIEEYRESRFHIDSVAEILERTSELQEAPNAYVDMEFTYFMEKESPLSQKRGLMNFDCGFGGMIKDGEITHWITADVPITTLCPCSKKNSHEGAHNQRALVSTKVVIEERVWLEELIELIEAQGSSELYSVLKREDEAFVTDEAYENPKFVEDVVRDISVAISDHEQMHEFYVDCTSFESIHNHDAYARVIEGDIWQGRYLV